MLCRTKPGVFRLQGKIIRCSGGICQARPDDADDRIIAQLRLDARTTNAKLAVAAGMSESACLRRVKALERSGVIRGYTVVLDGRHHTTGTIVFVQITLERQTADFLHRFEAAARRCPEIRECYLMTGGSDYQLQISVQDLQKYERVHRDVLSALPGVLRIQSNFTIRPVVQPG